MAILSVTYRFLYQLLNSLVALLSAYSLGYQQADRLQWLCLLIIALAPMVQMIAPYDRKASYNQKIKLPLVSLLVISAVGLQLLVASQGLALWLGLACLAGFLVHNNLAE